MENKSPEQIVFKLQQIASLFPALHEVSYILDDFKKHMDFTKLYHELAMYEENVVLAEIDFTEDGVDADGVDKKDMDFHIDWITIQSEINQTSINVRDLKIIGKSSGWFEDIGNAWSIDINKMTENSFPMNHADTRILFRTEEERDIELKRVKLKLYKFSSIRFL